jgi:uncharacterized membrane protein
MIGLTPGDGIAIASVMGGIIVAIIKIIPSRKSAFCDEHHHISTTLCELKEDVKINNDSMHTKINKVSNDVSFIRGFLEKSKQEVL